MGRSMDGEGYVSSWGLPVTDYPHWLKRALLLTAIIHDLAIVFAGWSAIHQSPPTIQLAFDHLSLAWAWMLIAGGLIALFGSVARNMRIETTGCALTSVAKLVWVVAVLQAPFDSPFGADVLIGILVAGAAGTIWRFLSLWVSYYLRIRD